MGKCSKNIFKEHHCSKMNDVLRAINFSSTFQSVNNLYKNVELIKLQDICRLELVKFMYKLKHNELPKLFSNNFVKITIINMVLEKTPAPIIFFLVSAKNLHKTNYILEDQNYGIQLIFILNRNMGFVCETIYSVLTSLLLKNLPANCNCCGFN